MHLLRGEGGFRARGLQAETPQKGLERMPARTLTVLSRAEDETVGAKFPWNSASQDSTLHCTPILWLGGTQESGPPNILPLGPTTWKILLGPLAEA